MSKIVRPKTPFEFCAYPVLKEALEKTNYNQTEWCPSGSYSHKHGEQHKGMFTTDRAKNRAKTFPGIAKAMAEQWGGDIRECEGHHGRV